MSEAVSNHEAAPAPANQHAAAKGKRWYIIHAYSGFEKKVAASIMEQAGQKGLTDCFEQVVVPTEDVVEVRRGKKIQAERKFFPGYVLAKMDMTDATWQLVKNTPKVTGFLGGIARNLKFRYQFSVAPRRLNSISIRCTRSLALRRS
jgi:transcription antitermination factor NusG